MTSRDSAFLALGSAINGLLAYVFFVLASRSLGPESTAPVSVLWSYWAISGAVLTFPVQHWIISKFTGDGHEATVARSLPRLYAVVAVIAAGSGLLSYAFREQLFHEGGVAFPAMVAGVTFGSFFMGVVRGVQAGRGHYAATAVLFSAENVLRVGAAGVVIWAGGGAHAFGVALVLGPLVGVGWLRTLRMTPAPAGVSVARESLALVSGVAGGSLVAQVVLTGPPVVLALTSGAPADITAMFLALSVWRAPYLVALGVTPQLTTAMTHLAVDGSPRRLARASRITVAAVVAAAVAAAAIGLTILTPLLRFAFGEGVALDRVSLAALGVGTAFALGSLVLVLMLLALGRSRAATATWVVALVLAVLWMLAADVPPTPRVVVAFLVAEVSAFALLAAAVEWEARPRRADPLRVNHSRRG